MNAYQSYFHGMEWEEPYGYSQALLVKNTLYISGQLAHDAAGNLVGVDDFDAQIAATFKNMDKVLSHFGASREQIVSNTILAVELQNHFMAIAARHKAYFGTHRPVSTAMGVVELAFPKQLVEISAIAQLG